MQYAIIEIPDKYLTALLASSRQTNYQVTKTQLMNRRH